MKPEVENSKMKVANSAHSMQNKPGNFGFQIRDYMTTKEASEYLRKSNAWLLRRGDIPHYAGNPNVYAKKDLDDWFHSNKHQPMN